MNYDVTVEREKWVGGSDVGAIMGLSPFKTRYELLCEKAGLTHDDFEGNKYTRYGDEMEGKIRAYINEKYKTDFKPDRKFKGVVRYHADGANVDTILEIKTTSKIYETADEYRLYLVQLLTGLDTYGFQKGMLAVYHRPDDFSTEFDPERLQIFNICAGTYKTLTEEILAEIDRFRADLQRLKENPLLSEEDFQPTELVEISKEVVELEVKMAAFKDLEKQYKAMKAKLYEAMLEADVKSWTMPNGTKITRVDGTPASVKTVEEFDIEAFKIDNPIMYDKYIKEVIKETAGRAGYAKITLPKE